MRRKGEEGEMEKTSEKYDEIPPEILKKLFYIMLKIRRVEEKLIDLYPAQDMQTPIHLYIGEEAIAAGVCLNLQKEDYVFSNHRGHGHYIAKDGNLGAMMAEFYGRQTGCCKGKGGSMHLVDPDNGLMGASAIVGGGIPIAAGAALAAVMQRNGRVSVAFFGDGAVDEGAFHEGLNFASLKKLPVIFVCENNFYATHSHQLKRQPADNIYQRAEGYMIPGFRVDGNDAITVFKVAREAIQRARTGNGPTLIECRTYRWKGHVGPDSDIKMGYRPQEELDEWRARCPIKRLQELLLNNNIIPEAELTLIAQQIETEIDEAVQYAKSSPYPDKYELLQDVY